jgi:hypothetical protein
MNRGCFEAVLMKKTPRTLEVKPHVAMLGNSSQFGTIIIFPK